MFDLKIGASPRRLRKAFLKTDHAALQKMGKELRKALSQLKNPEERLVLKKGFWRDFFHAFHRLIIKIILLRVAGTGALLIAIFASGWILREAHGLMMGFSIISIYLIFQCVEAVCGATARRLQQEAGIGSQTFFTALVNAKLLRLDRHRADGFTTGNLKVLISSDTERISMFVIALLWGVMPSMLCLLILGPFILLRMGLSGLVGLSASFLTIPLLTWAGRYTSRQEGKIKAQEDHMATVIGEWVSNVRLLRYMGWQEQFRAKIAGILRRYIVESSVQHAIYIFCFGLSFVWWLVPIILMLATASALHRVMTLESVFTVIWMLNHLNGFIRLLPETILKFNAASACVARLNRFLNQPESQAHYLEDYPLNLSETLVPVKLILEDVTFGYGHAQVIRGISTAFDLMQTTGIIGTVGSGKTTLLQLLSGDLKPDSGRIWVVFDDGTRADLWHRNVHQHFRSFAGYVSQEPYLSNATFAENITLDESVNEKKLMKDLYFAGLAADVAAFEEGLHQEIGENGINLSGGQKQRLNLARSFYAERRLVFLDDPLSAVDSEMESVILGNIFRNSRHFIMVSHRLGELGRMDRLIVLDNGRIVEEGKPQDLGRRNASLLTRFLQKNGPSQKNMTRFGTDGQTAAR